MITNHYILAEDARRRELLREAGHYRLAKQVATLCKTLPSSSRQLLAHLGELLVT